MCNDRIKEEADWTERKIMEKWRYMGKASLILRTILITVLLFTLIGCSDNVHSQQTESTEEETTQSSVETEIEIVEFEKDGIMYSKELHSDFEVVYPMNDRRILSKELIFNEIVHLGGSIHSEGKCWIEIVTIGIPQLFKDEEIKYIGYTLYNCPGTFNGIVNGKDGYQMESKTVKYTYNEQESAYISILKEFTCYKGELKKRVEIKAFQKAINGAVIKADLTYQDGTEKTMYIGIECANEYNYKVLNFYELIYE